MVNLIVDMSPLIYASYFTLHGKLSWWMVHGVLNTILNLMDEFQPDNVTLAWGSKKNHKNNIYPAYRQGRKTKIDFDQKQFIQLVNIFSALQVPQMRKDWVEADQLIAAYVNSVDECIIISEDKDFFQLLTTKKLLKGKRRGWFSADTVCEKFGLKEATLMADFQALTGDSADNIPRILSTKDAQTILNLKGRLSTWFFKRDFSNVSQIVSDKLLKREDQLKVNYQLVDLRKEQLKDEYFLPSEGMNLAFVEDKFRKMSMKNFVRRFDEFERLANLNGSN